MTRGHTTNFLFSDGDYFTALTDRDCVRIGIVGGTCYDIPNGHAYYDRIIESTSRVEVEDLHDELFAAIEA